jgi:putative glutamine amidotransferase
MSQLKRKIYVVGPQKGYANWMNGELVDTIEKADLVVFTGGEDVSPELYNEPSHPTTGNSPRRDKEEVIEYTKAKALNKSMIGICRGSQFLCVMAGGKLVQHQMNPLNVHSIETLDGKTIDITSSHHQAQYPFLLKPDEEYKLLAWTKGMSKYHFDGVGKELSLIDGKEAEIVYYPKIKALGIQGHPEWMGREEYKETFNYLDNLLNKHLAEEL